MSTRNAKFTGDNAMLFLTTPNCRNVYRCQFRSRVRLTLAPSEIFNVPALADRISSVVSWRSKKEMIGIYTRRVIAFVTNHLIARVDNTKRESSMEVS